MFFHELWRCAVTLPLGSTFAHLTICRVVHADPEAVAEHRAALSLLDVGAVWVLLIDVHTVVALQRLGGTEDSQEHCQAQR